MRRSIEAAQSATVPPNGPFHIKEEVYGGKTLTLGTAGNLTAAKRAVLSRLGLSAEQIRPLPGEVTRWSWDWNSEAQTVSLVFRGSGQMDTHTVFIKVGEE